MQISPGSTFGKSGRARAPERLVKSDGIQTLVMKLRLVQSLPGRNLTRLDFFAPLCCAWRTILRLFAKGFGTAEERYNRRGSNQTAGVRLKSAGEGAPSNLVLATLAEGRRKSHNVAADLGAGRARRPGFGNVQRADSHRRTHWGNCARRTFAGASLAENREQRLRTVFRFAKDQQP